MDYLKDSEIFKLLGNSVRLKLLVQLMEPKNNSVHCIAEKMKLPQSTISQHLSLLKSRGLVSFNRNGSESYYFISDQRVGQILNLMDKGV